MGHIRSVMRAGAAGLIVAAAIAGGSCKDKPPTTPTTNYVVTITAAGVSPTTIDVPIGSRVRFVNNDTRSHYIHSDPHPDATDCPPLNSVGLLSPGQGRETSNLVDPGTCGYHDHDTPSLAEFKGRITIR